MKKVSGYIYVRALGQYDFEFYVEDNATKEEIKEQVEAVANYYIHYDVEDGYIAETQTVYRKKNYWEE